jgi:hypothetical protein
LVSLAVQVFRKIILPPRGHLDQTNGHMVLDKLSPAVFHYLESQARETTWKVHKTLLHMHVLRF